MAIGKVKWFNNAKGYGFILPEDESEDLFVHYSAIEMDGYRTLKAGQVVEFDVVEGPKGLHAVNIRGSGEADADTQSNTSAAPEDSNSELGVSVDFDVDGNSSVGSDDDLGDASSG